MATDVQRMYAIGLMAFVLFLSSLVSLPVLPRLSAELGADTHEIPIVVSAALATVVVAQFFAGSLADRFSRKRLILLGAFLGSVSSLLCVLVDSWVELLLLRVVGGVADAISMPALLAITSTLGKDTPGRFFGILRGSQGLSFVAGPAIGSALSLVSLRTPFLVDGIMPLVAFGAGFALIQGGEKAASEHHLAGGLLGNVVFARRQKTTQNRTESCRSVSSILLQEDNMDVTRISACSYPLREKDLDYTLKVISGAGFRKVDLLGRVPHFSATDPDYSMDELKRLLEKYDLKLANIGSYCGQGFSAETEDERQVAVDEMRKTLEAAKQFGARSIRIMPGDGKRASIDTVAPYFKEAAEYSEKLGGIYMGIENHGGEISGNPEACAEISEKVGSKYFGILYEPANLMGADTEYKPAFDVFKDHIVHIHIKDGVYNAEGKWERTMLGDGVIDLHWVWEKMESIGYDGDYALEFEVGNIEPVETGYRKWYDAWERA